MKNKPLALYIIYLWLAFFCLFPMSVMVIVSFLTRNTSHLISLPLTFANYSALFSPEFIKIFFRSLSMASLTTFFCLLLAYPFSYIMVKSKQQSLLLLLIIIPFWTSSLIRTYSLIAILKNKGLINTLLLKLDVIHAPLSLLYFNFSVLIGLIYNLFPFMVLPLFTNMERFDFKLIEAAKDLGAGKWVLFSRIFLPNTAQGIFSGCLLVLLPAMTLFYIPNVLGGSRSILIGNMIQDQFLVLGNWPQGAATSVLLTLLLLLLLRLFRRYSAEAKP